MLVKTLDGKEVKWNFSKFYDRKHRVGKSKYHVLARELLHELIPNSSLYEEVTLPTTPATYADFFVPSIYLVVEVHGEQHYNFNSFFHNDKLAFYKAKAKDRMKKSWCELNNFKFVELPFNETDTWKKTIAESISQ